ncbi:MAG TPA: peptide-N4-asparagine amidase [Acidobacteriaceae bacterium]
MSFAAKSLAPAILAMAFVLAVNSASAQVVPAPAKPVIGSSNTVSADPAVPRPDTKPCTVTLFSNLEFADYNTKTYSYAPPADCPGPWSKVVFTADFTVTKGRQYDRTEQFYLGGANLLYGTTAEPRAALSPSWHVENDVTDLTAILKSPQDGTAILGNFVGVYNGVTYDGVIYGTAKLLFYPVGRNAPEAKTPDVVIGMPGNNGAYTLNTSTDQLLQAVTLPTNVEKVYLDVISQSQSGDEFWYLCVPNDVAGELESCGNTGYRETEISIDGTPAGVAPVYPWIFTGGIDPYLWEPIPGVQTLNFKPFRVDLTPFAGLLADGKAHNVGISVFNADSYFLSTATLLAYPDKGAAKTTGSLLSNTLVGTPTPKITEKLTTDASGDVNGSVKVASSRKYAITGNLHTSHGLVTTRVEGELNFSNNQAFVIDAAEYKQNLTQSTEGRITTTTTGGGKASADVKIISYPFTFLYDQLQNADGTFTITNKSDQKYLVNVDGLKAGGPFGFAIPFVGATANEVQSTNYLYYDANGNYTGNAGTSSQNYVTLDSTGYCYSATLDSKNLALTSAKYNQLCKFF